MRIPESRKFFLQESGIREILLVEYPEYLSRNPEFQELLAFAILVPMIKNRNLVNGSLIRGMQDPRLCWISLRGADLGK